MHVTVPKLIIIILIFIIFIRDISFAELLDVVVLVANVVVDSTIVGVVVSLAVVSDSVVVIEPKKKQIVVYANLFKHDYICFIF